MYEQTRFDLDFSNTRALLLEIVRRAAYDWVMYRGNRRIKLRAFAKDAYVWLFVEKPGHPDWIERGRAGWSAFSFLSICALLDLDPEEVRKHIRLLTPRRIQSMGRPPTVRHPSPVQEMGCLLPEGSSIPGMASEVGSLLEADTSPERSEENRARAVDLTW